MALARLPRSYLLALTCGLVSLAISLLPQATNVQNAYTYKRDDYPEFLPVPNMGEVLMTTEESVHYQIEGEDGRYDWASVEPIGGGYVHLGDDQRAFAYAMGHELHCLHRIRVTIGDPGNPLGDLGHARHCLNYLRQWILCTPDLTLEPFDPLARDFETERTGQTHVCQNWQALWDFAADNANEWKEFKNRTSSRP